MSDLRESGAIEQDADIVAFIHRPEYYGINQDENGMPTAGMAEIILAKHRNGAVCDVNLRFLKEQARFADLEDSDVYKRQGFAGGDSQRRQPAQQSRLPGRRAGLPVDDAGGGPGRAAFRAGRGGDPDLRAGASLSLIHISSRF